MSRTPRPSMDLAAVTSCFARPIYDAAAVEDLFNVVGQPSDAAGKLDAVRHALYDITAVFASDLWAEAQPGASEEQTRSLELAAACGRVLALVGAGDGEPEAADLYPFFAGGGLFAAASLRVRHDAHAATAEAPPGRRGESAVMDALRGVHLLRQDALRLAEIAGRRNVLKPGRAGRPEARALKRLVASLAALYANVWDKEPGAALDPQPGPFVRLMLHVAGALKARLGNHSFSYSADSLAKMWARLPPDEKAKREVPANWIS